MSALADIAHRFPTVACYTVGWQQPEGEDGRLALPYAFPASSACLEKGIAPKEWGATSLLQVLTRRHSQDTWFQAVHWPGRLRWPRLAKAILLDEERDHSPGLAYVVVDLDRPDHTRSPWATVEEAADAVRETALRLDCSVYATRGGLRAVWVLETLVPLDLAQSYLNGFHATLPDGLPVDPDRGVKDWTRGFRVPWCPRADKKRAPWEGYAPPMQLEPMLDGQVLRWEVSELQSETTFRAAPVDWRVEAPHDRNTKRVAGWFGPQLEELCNASSRHAVLIAKARALGGLCRGAIEIAREPGPVDPEPFLQALIHATDTTNAARTARQALDFGAHEPWWFEVDESPVELSPRRRGHLELAPPPDDNAPPDSVYDEEAPTSTGTEPGEAEAPPPRLTLGEVAVAALQRAIETEDYEALYAQPDVLRGIVRPGAQAGEVERLLQQLPHKHRTALKRAGKAIVASDKSPTAGPQLARPEGLPLLVENGKTWWVFDGSSYLQVSKDLAAVEVMRLHPHIKTTVPVGESGQRYLTPVELYAALGETAKKVRWTYNAEGARWDALTRVLDIPGARVCAGPARHSERVARWLKLLVDKPELMLDWLATCPQLDRPTSAAQLKGPDSIGKAMLAAALTTWLGGRVNYRHATGDYSAGLIHGPLVLLDEGTADSRPDEFRSLTGNHEHEVMAKFRMPETLLGCPRVLITSNENDSLQLGREELSVYSENALGRRILVFEGQEAAAIYLAELGGWDATGDWAKADGELVCHLRWLAENREVKPGKRFLVEGDASSWVASAHLRAGLASEVVQAYVAYEDLVEEGRTGSMSEPQPFHFDPDQPELVGISVGGLQGNWKKLVGDARAPSHQALSKVLRRLSGQEQPKRIGTKNDRGPRVYLVEQSKLTIE